MNTLRQLLLLAGAVLTMQAQAGNFDGSKPLICAPVTAMDCIRGDDCLTGLPEDVGAPAFMRIDFARKTVTGSKRNTDILLTDKTDGQLLLQGRESGFGWSIAIDNESGEMTVTLANRSGAFVLFGSCTPL